MIYIYIYTRRKVGGLKPPTLLDHLTLRAKAQDLRATPLIAKVNAQCHS